MCVEEFVQLCTSLERHRSRCSRWNSHRHSGSAAAAAGIPTATARVKGLCLPLPGRVFPAEFPTLTPSQACRSSPSLPAPLQRPWHTICCENTSGLILSYSGCYFRRVVRRALSCPAPLKTRCAFAPFCGSASLATPTPGSSIPIARGTIKTMDVFFCSALLFLGTTRTIRRVCWNFCKAFERPMPALAWERMSSACLCIETLSSKSAYWSQLAGRLEPFEVDADEANVTMAAVGLVGRTTARVKEESEIGNKTMIMISYLFAWKVPSAGRAKRNTSAHFRCRLSLLAPHALRPCSVSKILGNTRIRSAHEGLAVPATRCPVLLLVICAGLPASWRDVHKG